MRPYSYYIKQAEGASDARPSYTSATETAGKAFQPPKYYERPGVNPQLAAQGRQLEQEYASAFPYGDYTYSTKGWGYRGGERTQMDQSQIDLRTRFKLYEAQAMNAMPSNPQLAQQSPSAAGAFFGDLARSPISPTAPLMYGYDVATKGFQQASADKAKSDAVYRDMLLDSTKRVANRYGANFDLNYANDPLLDYSSYALEAAPFLLATALTGGGNIGVQAAARTGAQAVARTGVQTAARTGAPNVFRQAGQTLVQGFRPVMQGSANRFVRFAGEAIPGAANYALSAMNPIPLVTSAVQAAPGATKLLSMLGANFALRGAANNYGNAYRDTAAFNAANPELAGTPASAARFGESLLAGGASFDPTALNKFGLGASLLAPGMDEKRQQAIDEAVQMRISQIPDDDPNKQLLLNNPAAIEELRRKISDRFNSRGFIASAIEPAAKVTTFNPFRALGATTYGEDLAADRNIASAVAQDVTGLRSTRLQDPRFLATLDRYAAETDPNRLMSTPFGRELMTTPIAGLVGNDPIRAVQATQSVVILNDALSRMQLQYQQTGQVPPGYVELVQQAKNLAEAQQLPAAIQESGNTPFADAVTQLDSVLQQIYNSQQLAQGAAP